MGVNPLISVVTINLNDGNGLSETLSSIFGQDCESSMFESVVIDGGSVDKSRDVILANEKRISYWCSEPDDGIYSAMNHGIQRSRGEYIVFLNSADIFASSNVLRNVIDGISSNGWADIIYGDYIRKQSDGSKKNIKQPDKITPREFRPPLCWGISHQSVFYKRELLVRMGGYDESYSIAGDWELTLRALYKYGARQRHLPVVVCEHTIGGISDTDTKKSLAEIERVWDSLFPELEADDYRFYADRCFFYRRRANHGESLFDRGLFFRAVFAAGLIFLPVITKKKFYESFD